MWQLERLRRNGEVVMGRVVDEHMDGLSSPRRYLIRHAFSPTQDGIPEVSDRPGFTITIGGQEYGPNAGLPDDLIIADEEADYDLFKTLRRRQAIPVTFLPTDLSVSAVGEVTLARVTTGWFPLCLKTLMLLLMIVCLVLMIGHWVYLGPTGRSRGSTSC